MLVADGALRPCAHEVEAGDEEESENDVERDRNGEVRQRELDYCMRPERRIRARRLEIVRMDMAAAAVGSMVCGLGNRNTCAREVASGNVRNLMFTREWERAPA